MQSGVQGASELRLVQLKEEYGWIETVIEPLADLNVPCNATDLFDRWRQAHTGSSRLPPPVERPKQEPVEFHEMPEDRLAALLSALKRIGVAERRADNRINVPYIYRVAAKLLRRGE